MFSRPARDCSFIIAIHNLYDCWKISKTEKTKTMSDRKHSDEIITNEDTVNRRAWVEKAVSVVKGMVTDRGDSVDAGKQTSKPKLYVVNTNRPR